MSKQPKDYEYIQTIGLTIKDVWKSNSFRKKDGSTGTVQRILNVGEPTLILWSMDPINHDKIGERYVISDVVKKKNKDGYHEYHSTKKSRLGWVDEPSPQSSVDLSGITSTLENILTTQREIRASLKKSEVIQEEIFK